MNYNLLLIVVMFFCVNLIGQNRQDNYTQEWIIIDSLIIKSNLPKTALKKVEALYRESKANNRPDQVIKALLYKLSIEESIVESNGGLNLAPIEYEIKSATDSIQKSILQVILAKNYFRYYENMRWEIMNRKNSNSIDTNEVETWTERFFQQKITAAFDEALKNKKLLQGITVKEFSAIVKGISPTYSTINLFDLLALEAINYLKTAYDQNILINPDEIVKDEALLNTVSSFLNINKVEKESSKTIWKIIYLYQQILRFHEKDRDQNLFVQVNIDRIKWANSILQLSQKNKLYLNALQAIIDNNQQETTSISAWYLLAEEEKKKGDLYNANTDSVNRYCYNNVIALSNKAKILFGEKNWEKSGLYNLNEEVLRKIIVSTVEKINAPGKPLRALITYKNVDTLYARVIKINNDLSKQHNNNILKHLLLKQSISTFIQALPTTYDHQQHGVEIKIDALGIGRYALVCSNNKDFKEDEDYISISYFNVSNLTYLKDKGRYFIRDYNNGAAVGNVQVNLYSSKYDYKSGRINYTMLKQIKSDKNGTFKLDSNKEYIGNTVLELIKGNEYLWAEENEYFYNSNAFNNDSKSDSTRFEDESKTVLFYTDRSIYRPNQLVYFKGISIKKSFKTKLFQVNEQKIPIKVFLRDGNYIKKDSLILVPNEFGSISGNFLIKEGGLAGRYMIEAENYHRANVSFNVEEYKRPSFEILIHNEKEIFRLNRQAAIKGSAVAFAGNVINQASVTYSIKQEVFNKLRPRPQPAYGVKLIAEGSTKTNDKGEFSIPFISDYDLMDDTIEQTAITYSITISVTDLNGETRTTQSTIIAANYIGNLNIKQEGVIEKKQFTSIESKLINLHGDLKNSVIVIQLQKAEVPERITKKRFWEKPDQFVITQAAFSNYFPNDEYASEGDHRNWSYHTIKLTDSVIQSNQSTKLAIDNSLIEAGVYKITATAVDSFGKKITASNYVLVYDQQKKIIPLHSYDFSTRTSYEAQPGDTIRLLHLNGIPSIPIIRKLKRGNTATEEYINLSLDKIDETELIISEKDRGGIVVTDAYVYAGRLYTKQYQINVPWINKQLNIKYGTYKNIIEPGSKEKYIVTVSGADGSNKIAELLCTMYDASLEQLSPHSWRNPNLWEHNTSSIISSTLFTNAVNHEFYPYINYKEIETIDLPELLYTGDDILNQNSMVWLNDTSAHVNLRMKRNLMTLNDAVIVGAKVKNLPPAPMAAIKIMGEKPIQEESYDKVFTPIAQTDNETAVEKINVRRYIPNQVDPFNLQIRKNFNETAFFFPQLHADSTGAFSFEFTMPDAITQWNWMSLAHSTDLSMGKQFTQVISQKKLMVQPNMPRFLREGDQLELTTKIANLTDHEITGTVRLELIDASTNQLVDGWFQNVFPNQYFTAEAGTSTAIQFPIQIPFSYNKPLILKIIATSGNYFDGVENTLPVLSKRQIVTQSFPIFLPKDTMQQFVFESLKNQESESLTHQSLTVEYTSQPIWNVIKALPYLIEDKYDNIVQQFNRFYANSIVTYILEKNPSIKNIFLKWEKDTTALINSLEKNTALKQILIQETPWVLDAQSQRKQLHQLVTLFNAEKMDAANEKCIQLLEDMQLSNGAFPWFKGGNENEYITQYILTGIGKLYRIGALPNPTSLRLKPLIIKALGYADEKIIRDYHERKKNKTPIDQQEIYGWHITQLYMRSFFYNIQPKDEAIQQYYLQQGKKFWTKLNTYYQAMLAIVANRAGDAKFSIQKILPALLENSVENSKQGMYWKNSITRYWYNSPVNHQCMMIDCFSEINQSAKNINYTTSINNMRTWLLLQKQTNFWESTITTADVCYTLLQSGTDWLNSSRKVHIKMGDISINSEQEITTEGTGYFSKKIPVELIKSDMGNIFIETITSSVKTEEKDQPSYGAIYWQYLEDINKVKYSAGPLSIQKSLLVERKDSTGKIWATVKEDQIIHVGEKVIVQLIIKTDRDMEYIHIKDLRASGMEPTNVLSGYKWQDRFGYYQQTKDVSSHFFIDYLFKGTYVLNYELVATHEGIFSAGNATIQCMYAPEFIGNSTGNLIRIVNQ